jgi:hypothetical protein
MASQEPGATSQASAIATINGQNVIDDLAQFAASNSV